MAVRLARPISWSIEKRFSSFVRLRDELDECFGCGDLERVQKALRRASNAPAADQTELFMPIKMLQVRAIMIRCQVLLCAAPRANLRRR